MNSEFFHQLMTDRNFSWPIVGILLIIGTLVIRFFLLHDILRELKYHNKAWYKSAQTHYQKHSITGWVIYLVSIAGLILLWRFEPFFVRFANFLCWVLIFTVLLMLSYLIHLKKYIKAIFKAMPAPAPQDTDIPRLC